jgi:acyl carrier protein
MLTMSDEKKINNIIKKVIRKKISLKKNLLRSGIDSLDLTTIFLSIEDEFNIKFKRNYYDKLKTVDDFVKYIKKNKKKSK